MPIGHTTTLNTVRLPKDHSAASQKDNLTYTNTHTHDTATPFCEPTRYDLHLRDGKEKTRARKKRELGSKRMNRTGEAPVLLLQTGLFLPSVEF